MDILSLLPGTMANLLPAIGGSTLSSLSRNQNRTMATKSSAGNAANRRQSKTTILKSSESLTGMLFAEVVRVEVKSVTEVRPTHKAQPDVNPEVASEEEATFVAGELTIEQMRDTRAIEEQRSSILSRTLRYRDTLIHILVKETKATKLYRVISGPGYFRTPFFQV
ncbi:uncharacterized protein KD926_008064 [Aspergillus affinis]|uniref:uncharacterized protein n=1 Tax=Aspergillus affinis TaxID=1070780 RepID=UPI0022FE5272|nr:uncharacterized protein KD926_008064 [Aspergillus affinis]KAI9045647.1 hypothetical protein KD926_008064 [Aspergillus affinis]